MLISYFVIINFSQTLQEVEENCSQIHDDKGKQFEYDRHSS